MILCLDANVIVDVLRRREGVTPHWQAAVSRAAPLVVSPVVLHELEAGVQLSARPATQRARLYEVLAAAELVEFDAEDATASGRLRARLQLAGRPIGALDTLIAGQALARGWMVATRNIRHFGRVEGLGLIDWSVGPEPLPPAAVAARVAEGD